ncbi:unnamed protein product [Effrenium voratum]|uniref:Uncharacterized protein n=1 Tax=Effrenium voratum TaxID=2562239 RepID=A0AA36J8Q0_9DINO|nr:unnamed protein product [Effrenium voratum]CAJ1441194.1 unnamed protein product [Effrenium voratum]
MVRSSSARQNLAWAFIFLLAMQDVHAARNSNLAAELASLSSLSAEAKQEYEDKKAAVLASGAFSITTMWAKGDPSSSAWANATVRFEYTAGGSGEPAQYVSMLGLNRPYRLLPDGSVVSKQVKGMQVLAFVGWQALDTDKNQWGPSNYEKNKALFLRTEMNPAIGVTTFALMRRSGGHTVYQSKKPGSEAYYFDSKGKMQTVGDSGIAKSTPVPAEPLMMKIAGEPDKAFKKANRDLMLAVDAMLGQSSCMNSPSKCAFRCMYDSEKDRCGPTGFCQKLDATDGPSVLAPFGQQQKCKAVGADSHEAADGVLTLQVEAMKTKALDLSKQLEESPEVTKSSASKSAMKHTADLWEEATHLMNVLETMPARLGPDTGKFPAAGARASEPDFKTWKHGAHPLTPAQYQEAHSQSVNALRRSNSHSVVAKLHSELVDFMIKRPTVLIESVKAQSSKKCQLTDKDAAGKNQISTFAKYFLKAPGYNPSDLQRAHVDLPEHCQEYLASVEQVDPEEMASTIEATEEAVENPASLLQMKSKHLHNALSQDEVGSSFLQGDAEVDTEILVIFLTIILLIVFMILFMCAVVAAGEMARDGNVAGYFFCALFGGLATAGFFMMAWPVGLGVLLFSIIALDMAIRGPRKSGYMQKGVRDDRRLLDLAATAM